jgi:hypothetical protein
VGGVSRRELISLPVSPSWWVDPDLGGTASWPVMTAGRLSILFALASLWLPIRAAEPKSEPSTSPAAARKLGWFNATDLSIVYTEGNSSARSYGFDNTLRAVWERSRFKFRIDWVRADTSDDPYLLVQPGLTFLPGETLDDPPTTEERPPAKLDFEKFLVESEYGREISRRVFWSVGGSWDRNEDAGILGRFIAFGSIGNLWYDLDDFRWTTTYGLSYTDRNETEPDPQKEEKFGGVRLASNFRMKIGDVTTFTNDAAGIVSLADTGDYTLDIASAISVSMSKRLALKVSLQWQVNSEPALEDADVVARVLVVDPDGVPGNGDEYFQTVSSGGYEIVLGEDRIRKEQLDTVFRTTLVVNF